MSAGDDIDHFERVHRHLVRYLAGLCRAGQQDAVASLCQDQLDKSGRLLREVRQAARLSELAEGAAIPNRFYISEDIRD